MTRICNKKGCQKYVWVEPRTGIEHKYCGRSHAQECEGERLKSPHGPCHTCNLEGCSNIVAFDQTTGRVHDFCCRQHAKEAVSKGEWPAPAALLRSRGSITTSSSRFTRTCSFSGCSLPCFHDANTGLVHDFCGRSHAIQAKRAATTTDITTSTVTATTSEKVVIFKRVHSDSSAEPEEEHQPSCCTSCGDNRSKRAAGAGRILAPPHETCIDCNEKTVFEWMCKFCSMMNMKDDPQCIMCSKGCPTTTGPGGCNKSKCGLPGCNEAAVYYGFCGQKHLDKAVYKKMLPPMIDGVDRTFQDPSNEYTVHLLTGRHLQYSSIKDQFISSWSNSNNGEPRLERIYWICLSEEVHRRYNRTEKAIGNVKRRFHGTSQSPTCMFGIDPSVPPCHGQDCNVCSICRQSFRLNKASSGGGTRMNLRYGEGLYFSPVSSKSHDYNGGSEKVYKSNDRKWRAMFLCNVVVGKAFVTRDATLPSQDCPPRGFDSVVGEAGLHLNYPEVVVYEEAQAIPTYLVIYSV